MVRVSWLVALPKPVHVCGPALWWWACTRAGVCCWAPSTAQEEKEEGGVACGGPNMHLMHYVLHARARVWMCFLCWRVPYQAGGCGGAVSQGFAAVVPFLHGRGVLACPGLLSRRLPVMWQCMQQDMHMDILAHAHTRVLEHNSEHWACALVPCALVAGACLEC